tara:strand:+ start:538 stop:807 length:270 start_codon:yes stop_codon:yes gene_type:complete
MGDSILYYPLYKEINNNKDNMKPIDKNLEQLLYITGQSHANTSAYSSEFGKLRLLRELVSEIEDLNLDNASRVKIRLWLDKHQNKINVE